MVEYINIDKKKAFYADMALILAAALWGGEYIAIKFALNEFSPLYLNVFRFCLGTCVTAAIFRKRIKIINRDYLKGGVFLAISSFAGYAFMTMAMLHTTVATIAFLVATYTVWVPVLTVIIYKRKPQWYILCGVFLCILGVYFLTIQGDLKFGLGGVLGLGSAIAFSFSIILKEYYVKRLDAVAITITQDGFTALFYLFAAVILEPIPTFSGHSESLIALLYMVFGATVAAHLIISVSLKYTSATRQVIIISLESVFASLLGYFMLKEAITLSMILGMGLIISAIILIETELKFVISFIKKIRYKHSS